MIQHMNLVFQADGLSTGEGAFLLACCNHTDDRGYVIASMQQLADEAHMKERTARENKQRLIKRNLLKTADRYSPKNGARLADLYRVNIDLLKQMQRKRVDYGPSLVEQITFDASPKTAGQHPPADSAAPPADSAAPPADSAGGVPADSAPLFLPSSSPSSLSPVTADADRASGIAPDGREREATGPEDTPGVPQQRAEQAADSGAVDLVLAGWAAGAGLQRPPASVVGQLAGQVAELAAEYATSDELRTIAEFAGHRRWTDLGRAAMHPECAKRLAAARPGQAGGAGSRERCPDHPARYRKGCLDCAMAVPA